jgi:hypothetical protein
MKKIFLMACAAAIFASMSVASAEQQNEWGYTGDDYTGPFTTQTLYTMCSQKKTRDKCLAYIQGLEYGIAISKSMAEKSPSLRFCPPRMTRYCRQFRALRALRDPAPPAWWPSWGFGIVTKVRTLKTGETVGGIPSTCSAQ